MALFLLLENQMFVRITIELTKRELEEIIKEKVKATYDQNCTVEFTTADEWHGYGANESKTTVFKGAKVSLVPKNGSNQR